MIHSTNHFTLIVCKVKSFLLNASTILLSILKHEVYSWINSSPLICQYLTLLKIDITKGLIVRVDNKFLWLETMMQMLQILHYYVKLLIVNIVMFCLTDFSPKKLIRWFSWLSTPSILIPDASHAISKNFEKS